MKPSKNLFFPELKGIHNEKAKESILKEHPNLQVYVVPEGAMVTMDYRMDRVRLYVNEEGIVVRPPRVG